MEREYRPVLISRRGEAIAWGLATLVVGTWAALGFLGRPVSAAVPLLAIALLLSALSISLGNWMDRRTRIHLAANGLDFENGLRRVHLDWGQIRQVKILPGRWGKKVQVLGERAYFQFNTLGEVRLQGVLKGRVGFELGDEILQRIIEQGHLRLLQSAASGTTYGRA